MKLLSEYEQKAETSIAILEGNLSTKSNLLIQTGFPKNLTPRRLAEKSHAKTQRRQDFRE
jgi:hypothetical protein